MNRTLTTTPLPRTVRTYFDVATIESQQGMCLVNTVVIVWSYALKVFQAIVSMVSIFVMNVKVGGNLSEGLHPYKPVLGNALAVDENLFVACHARILSEFRISSAKNRFILK